MLHTVWSLLNSVPVVFCLALLVFVDAVQMRSLRKENAALREELGRP
jgi:hypothetical protein